MSDDDTRQRLENLEDLPLDEHADVLDEIHGQLVAELDDLRRRVPGAADAGAR